MLKLLYVFSCSYLESVLVVWNLEQHRSQSQTRPLVLASEQLSGPYSLTTYLWNRRGWQSCLLRASSSKNTLMYALLFFVCLFVCWFVCLFVCLFVCSLYFTTELCVINAQCLFCVNLRVCNVLNNGTSLKIFNCSLSCPYDFCLDETMLDHF